LADTFGSGANAFDIEFVTIGNPGNLPDAIDKANALGGLGITKGTRGPDTACSRKHLAQFGERFDELHLRQARGRIEDHRLFNREQSIRSDVTPHFELAALEITRVERDRITIAVRLAGDLAEDQVVARQIDDNQCRPTLAQLQVGLRKGENHDLARYRFAHAASSSGVFQSRARTDSLASKPLNALSSDLSLKKRAKSYTSRWSESGKPSSSLSISSRVLIPEYYHKFVSPERQRS